jgi:hypothetical protein
MAVEQEIKGMGARKIERDKKDEKEQTTLAAISAELRPFRAEEVEGADSRNG